MLRSAFLLLLLGTTSSSSSSSSSFPPPRTELKDDGDDGGGGGDEGYCVRGHEDFVRGLPGYDAPLPSNWCSGYVSYDLPVSESQNKTIHTHYVLVEAESVADEDDDDDDDDDDVTGRPLIYWSNGGPGGSSLFGLMAELGPLLFSDRSLEGIGDGDIPRPIYNPRAWTRLGHVLIFDQPAPVGFSYCGDDDTRDDDEKLTEACMDIEWDDELTSLSAFMALQAFYDKFPSYLQHELYLTGESYAGIYIPTLARRVIQHNEEQEQRKQQQQQQQKQRDEEEADDDDAAVAVSYPLRGFAVGDGCLGTESEVCGNIGNEQWIDIWLPLFLVGHGQIPFDTFHDFLRACHPYHNRNEQTTDSDICKTVYRRLQEQAGGYYEYSLYDECTYRNGLLRHKMLRRQRDGEDDNGDQHEGEAVAVVVDGDGDGEEAILSGGLNDYPCGGDIVMGEYLTQFDSVKRAMHLKSTFFSVDNAEGGFKYTPTEKDLTPFYARVVNEYDATSSSSSPFKVLVYNGDADPAINSFAAQSWTSKMKFRVDQPWRPWTADSCQKVGGYVTRYSGGGGGGNGGNGENERNTFDFVTIRGAGHLVPTYKPEATFAFVKSWIEGRDYPRYDKNCTSPPTGRTKKTTKESVIEDRAGERNTKNGEADHSAPAVAAAAAADATITDKTAAIVAPAKSSMTGRTKKTTKESVVEDRAGERNTKNGEADHSAPVVAADADADADAAVTDKTAGIVAPAKSSMTDEKTAASIGGIGGGAEKSTDGAITATATTTSSTPRLRRE